MLFLVLLSAILSNCKTIRTFCGLTFMEVSLNVVNISCFQEVQAKRKQDFLEKEKREKEILKKRQEDEKKKIEETRKYVLRAKSK